MGMKQCSCHPSACKECLRATYISHSLHDPNTYLDRAYPLRCFWPGCERPLGDVQVKKITQSREDIENYYNFVARKKIQRMEEGKWLSDRANRAREHLNKFRTIQNCPSCGHPNTVRPYRNISDADTKVCCLKCSEMFEVQKLPRKEILSVLDAMGDEIAACPSCGAFFVKDGGCDHMTCVCGKEFSFLQQISAGSKIRLRRDGLGAVTI